MLKRICTFLLVLVSMTSFAQANEPTTTGLEHNASAKDYHELHSGDLNPDSKKESATTESTSESKVLLEGRVAPEGLWDEAATAYINGHFDEAKAIYEELVARDFSSAKLYYNLANACFKTDELGKAILYYKRALKLAPGNEDYRYNLSVAEAQTKDTIEQVPEFFLTTWVRALRQTMGCTSWTVLSLVMLVGALTLCLAFLLAQRLLWRKIGFYGTLLAGLLFVVATWFAVSERDSILDESQAVVMSHSLAVKSSPDKAATDLFIIHEGTELHISNRLEDWCEVSIADGKKGWVEARKIEVI